MAERSDGDGMTVDDCAEISRAISVLLDTKDPIEGTYDLEISSPGIDRPLVKTEDFSRYVGFEVDVWMKKPLDGRRKFSGRLVKVNHTNVSIEVGPLGENVNMPLSHIGDAKLALTEDLVLAARSDTDNE
jgi:ribosome maturation factor RimP